MALVSTFVLYKLSSASDIKAPKFSWLKESCLYLFHDELRGLFFFFFFFFFCGYEFLLPPCSLFQDLDTGCYSSENEPIHSNI
jgi:hypothetical protein